jgi:hypothetical protein
MGFMFLGGRLVVIIVHDHVKQALDVTVFHNLPRFATTGTDGSAATSPEGPF